MHNTLDPPCSGLFANQTLYAFKTKSNDIFSRRTCTRFPETFCSTRGLNPARNAMIQSFE